MSADQSRGSMLLPDSGLAYGSIVVDPPWRYNKTGARVEGRMKGRGGGAERHYETMTFAEIAALPVGELAAESSHLYLWITNPKLYGDGKTSPLDIIQGWGFEYVTLLTWVKTGAPGLGWYFRGATEHVIFATRNKCPIPSELREPNYFTAPRGRHSEKPGAFFDLVERVSPGPYLELFARRQRMGWTVWGDEVESDFGERRPGVFDLRASLGQAPTVQEYRDAGV